MSQLRLVLPLESPTGPVSVHPRRASHPILLELVDRMVEYTEMSSLPSDS
jgi:hypothetical protein